jgi:FkbM family methyltransferase
MENTHQLTELSNRLRKIEEAVASISANLAALAQAHNQGVREILFSQVAYLGDYRALTYLRSGQKIFVDTRSVDIGTHLMWGGQWEPEYVAAFLKLLKPGDKVLDVGANHGVYALLAAPKVAPVGHVYAFEPSRNFCELIRASVSVNGLDQLVTVVNRAVADREFDTDLLADVHWSGGGHLIGEGGDAPQADTNLLRETVHCITLDDYFPNPADTVNVVKMDVEGAEGLVLKGMAGLIDRSPTLKIMMEFSPKMLARFPCDAVFVRDFLESRGFMCWTIRPDGSLAPAGWESLLASPTALQNIVLSRQGLR